MLTTAIGLCFMVGAVVWATAAWVVTGMTECRMRNEWVRAIPHWFGSLVPLALGVALVWR